MVSHVRIGMEPVRGFEYGDRLGIAAGRVRQGDSQIVMRIGVTWREPHSRFAMRDRIR
jgi:hypothetical protein